MRYVWAVLAPIALISILIFFRSKAFVYITGTGMILGALAAIGFAFAGRGFQWNTIGAGCVCGAIAGLVFEIASRILGSNKNQKSP
jgi:hypothetical protein